MWITDSTLNAKAMPRPVRIAYLIPEASPQELLDAVIQEGLARWGGRRTMIIPTDGSSIDQAYWTVLDYWDADILYTYCDLSAELQDRLYHSFAPSEIVMHSDSSSTGNHAPVFEGNYQFLSALSVLPFFDQRAQRQGIAQPEILDNDIWGDEVRDLADSFGFVSRSCLAATVHPYARRIGVRQEGRSRQYYELETTYFETLDSWLETVVEKPSILMLARLSDMMCPSLRYWSDYKNGWNDHLTIVVGDAFEDRLLMWNAQHRYSGLNLGDDIPIIRVSPARLKDEIPKWLTTWIMQRNHRQLGHSNTGQVKIKSCSLQNEELERIVKLIGAPNVFISAEHFDSPNVFESENLNTESAVWAFPFMKAAKMRFRNNELDLPLSVPSHLDSASTSHFWHGIWATDLVIDRMENHSHASNIHHVWKFPRRLRMETSVKFENYASELSRRPGHLVPPPPRPTRTGSLVVWDCIDWTRPVFTLPSDYGAFCKSLHEMPYSSPKIQRLRKDAQESSNTVFNFRFNRVTISDKGRDLLGILQFFRSLPEALLYLNNPFWLRVIFKLLPEEPQDKQKYIKTISKLIAETKDGNTEGCEHIARRALDLAAQSFSSQDIKTYDFEALYGQAKEQQSLKQDRGGNELREELVDSVTYLRNRELLWQGFSWRCSFCEHQNWLSLERLTAISVCQICRKQESSPVAGSLHFRLNPFVEHAFASSSAQGPVLWCLNQLASHVSFSSNGPESSFAFAPALNIYTSNDSQPWSDIDISASINGLIYLVEVKRSFAGVNSKVVDQLYDLGDCIRPDVVMLAVHAEPPATGDVIELLKTLQSKLASIDVKFVLLTQKNQQPTFADHGIALPYGKEMQWAAW